jgi:hypothetical protein
MQGFVHPDDFHAGLFQQGLGERKGQRARQAACIGQGNELGKHILIGAQRSY